MTRPFTLCLAYYLNAGMLKVQCDALNALPFALRSKVTLVVVDDGSPVPAQLPAGLTFDARLYRMREDIAWNQDACRNLAASEAETEWLLLTDMDHVPTEALWRRLMGGVLAKGFAFTFARVSAPDMSPYHPHPNSYAVRRKDYDRAGGYDERYRGIYGTDGAFKKNLERIVTLAALPEALVRYPREVIPDASTTTLTRKSDENAARKKALDNQLKAGGSPPPARGLTKWDRIA